MTAGPTDLTVLANLTSFSPIFGLIISTNRPQRRPCSTFVGSQSAARIYRNTALWLAGAESGTWTPSSSISTRYVKLFVSKGITLRDVLLIIEVHNLDWDYI